MLERAQPPMSGRRITDNFGVRFNGSAGIVENGIERFGGDRFVAALAADWTISEAISLRFDIEHVSKDVTEPANIGLAAPNSALVPPATPGKRILPSIPDPSVNLGGENLRSASFATNALLRADIRLSSQFALTIEGGQAKTGRDRDAATFQNFDLRPASANYGNGVLSVSRTRGQKYRNRNVRAELAGAFATGPIVHNLIVGATSNWRYQNGRSSTRVNVAQNFFNPVDAVAPAPTVFTLSPLDIEDRGAYVVDRAQLGPFELLGGVRYSDYKSRAVSATGVVTDFRLKTFTPSVGLVVKPVTNMSVYATYLEGLEEVPPAPLTSANPADVLPPAKSKQYEAGIKAEPKSGILIQVAAFQIDRPSAFVDPVDNIYKLAGRARYRGVESSVTGEVSKQLSVYLSGQYLQAEVTTADFGGTGWKNPGKYR